MAGKEDSMKSTAAETVEEVVPRTFSGRHKQEETEVVGRMSGFSLRPCGDLVSGGLRPCTAGHTLMEEGEGEGEGEGKEKEKEEEKEKADLGCGGLLPRAGRHILANQILANQDAEVKDSLTAAKRKADDDSHVAAVGACSDEKTEATDSGDVKAPEIKWVEMPLEYMTWLLAQTREEGIMAEIMATDEAWKEEFFAFQEWVRHTYDKNGCVMVPEDFNGPNPGGLQDLIDEAWEKGMRELEREENTAGALPSN